MSLQQNSATTKYPYRGAGYAYENREAQIEAHLHQVKFIAERLAYKLPPSVDLDDLIGAGMVGLMDAVEKFNPEKGVMFKTYAETRVRGAMLDSLRDLDWAPRSLRRRAREVEAAYLEAERIHGQASESNVAQILGISITEFQGLLGELRGLTITGLNADEEDENGHVHHLSAGLDRTPLAIYELAEVQARLTDAIGRLPSRERQVVAFYYVEELTMKEIGSVLGVTESRVSQIHTQAVIRLRTYLNSMRPSPAPAF